MPSNVPTCCQVGTSLCVASSPLGVCCPGGPPPPRHRDDGPSHEVSGPSEYFEQRRCEPSGSLASTSVSAVFRLTRVGPSAAVPRPLRARVHPLLGFPPLQSSNRSSLPAARTRRAPPTGFRPSFAMSDQGVHSPAAIPPLPMFRPRCFAHPRRLAPPCSLPACFIRLPRPRFPLQGFPPMTSGSSSSLAPALLSVTGVRLRKGCPVRSSSRRPAFRALFQPSIPSTRVVG